MHKWSMLTSPGLQHSTRLVVDIHAMLLRQL
jgi:hypothetical protein